MVSRFFPKGHVSEHEKTGFIDMIPHDKGHTIRSNYDYWYPKIQEVRAGKAYLSLRFWQGKPYQKGSKRVEFKKIYEADIEHLNMTFSNDQKTTNLIMQNKTGFQYPVIEVIKNDGLSDLDFFSWFYDTKVKAPCVQFLNDHCIIHFKNYKYERDFSSHTS